MNFLAKKNLHYYLYITVDFNIHLHPCILSRLSRTCFRRQQSKQRCPDLLLHRNSLQFCSKDASSPVENNNPVFPRALSQWNMPGIPTQGGMQEASKREVNWPLNVEEQRFHYKLLQTLNDHPGTLQNKLIWLFVSGILFLWSRPQVR